MTVARLSLPLQGLILSFVWCHIQNFTATKKQKRKKLETNVSLQWFPLGEKLKMSEPGAAHYVHYVAVLWAMLEMWRMEGDPDVGPVEENQKRCVGVGVKGGCCTLERESWGRRGGLVATAGAWGVVDPVQDDEWQAANHKDDSHD